MRKTDNFSSLNSAMLLFQNHRSRQTALFVLVLLCNATAMWSQKPGIPPNSQQVTSLAGSFSRSDHAQLHIFYVHGMAAEGPGYSESELFRKSICKYLKGCTSYAGEFDGREYADKDKFDLKAPIPQLTYWGDQIWKTRKSGDPSEEWHASAPFVDHWKLVSNNARTIYLDEINWWPLVFSSKCRQIVAKDAALAGPSAKFIDKCSTTKPDPTHPERYLSYSWIDDSDAQQLKAMPRRGALINRSLKHSVLDWGFSDAILAVGPMRPLLMEGIRELVLKSVKVSSDGSRGAAVVPAPNQEFVIVSHSLGSYLIFSALDVDPAESTSSTIREWKREFEYILGHTSEVYFFANQLRLLELANLDGVSKTTMIDHMEAWGKLRRAYLDSPGNSSRKDLTPPQIVAWSDPSDLLSWNVPELKTVLVKNIPVRNSIHWFWLIESPTRAHANYATNKSVLKVMFKPPAPTHTP